MRTRVSREEPGINLASRAHFGGVRPQKDCLRIGFVLDREVNDPRVLRIERISPTVIGHSVKVYGPDDLDEQLLAWLAEAYGLRCEPRVAPTGG